VRSREFSRRDDALHGNRRVRQRDVFPNGTIEENVFLQDHTSLPAQPSQIRHRQVDAVDQNASAQRHVESLDQFGYGAFAGTGGADHTNDLTGLDREGYVMQHFRAIDPVAKTHVIECDLPADGRQRGAAGTEAWLRDGIENVAKPVDGQTCLMKVLPKLRKPQHWLAHPRSQHVERDKLTDTHFAADHLLGADV